MSLCAVACHTTRQSAQAPGIHLSPLLPPPHHHEFLVVVVCGCMSHSAPRPGGAVCVISAVRYVPCDSINIREKDFIYISSYFVMQRDACVASDAMARLVQASSYRQLRCQITVNKMPKTFCRLYHMLCRAPVDDWYPMYNCVLEVCILLKIGILYYV